jgi:multidrug efflux system membrane fusion protein
MKKTRWIFVLLALSAVAAAMIWRNDSAKSSGAPKGPSSSSPSPIAVLATQVTTRDVPIWLTGIGTVQAYNTVIVRPRVSGALDKVNFTEGSMVKQGDVLAHIDPRPYQTTLDQALARKAQNEAQLLNARQELARVQTLVKSAAVSEQNLDQAKALVAQFEAVAQADAAAVAAAQLDLDFTVVRAPISGRTGIRQLDAGNVVTANQTEGLVTLTQLNPITIVFTLPQLHLPSLREHMQPGAAPLAVQAIGEDGSLLDEGKLELVDNQIDMSTGTLKLKASFANEKLTLWPGQFVSARLLVQTRKDATVVPMEVVQPGLDGPFAYLIKPDNTVEARQLQTGLSLDGWTIIEKGLSPGDRVVRDGQSKLKPGSLVSHKEVQS